MHLSSATLLAYSLIHGVTTALKFDSLRQHQIMASKGLLPDGTPIDPSTYRNKPQVQDIEKIPTEWAQLPLDHWDAGAGTFLNRFWATTKHYSPGGPVFVYDAGEGNAEGSVSELTDPDSFTMQLLRKFQGIGITWEHRYYGLSLPPGLNITASTPASSFEFLDTEQALADVSTFAWNFSRSSLPGVDLSPKSTPWVFLGGSYPGMRAALMRSVYPETIFASYASSAPVEASIDMSFYFEPIWSGMKFHNLSGCAADIHAAIGHIDSMLDFGSDSEAFALKEKFLGPGGGANSHAGFADALSVIFYGWQAYGINGGSSGVGSFCNWISQDPVTNTMADATTGWAAVKGVNFTLDRWISWPYWIKTVNREMKTDCVGPKEGVQSANISTSTSSSTRKCDLTSPSVEPDSISWGWQYCTQWGFFQSANLGDQQLISKHNSLEHQKEICHNQFPDGTASGFLPDWPKVDETNKRYGGWNVRPANTFWTGGMFDPWRTLSPLSDMSFSPKNKPSQEIPKCAASAIGDGEGDNAEGSTLFGYLMNDAQHCYDFYTSKSVGKPARELFGKALTQWLGCWTGSGAKNQTAVAEKQSIRATIRKVESPSRLH